MASQSYNKVEQSPGLRCHTGAPSFSMEKMFKWFSSGKHPSRAAMR